MSWKQSKYLAGSAVRVFQLGAPEDEDGTMLTDYDMGNIEKNEMPLFKLSDGKVVNGSDCYWIPKAELTEESQRTFDQLNSEAKSKQ